MQKWILIGLALLLTLTKAAYQPELMLTVQPQLINRAIASNNKTIIDAINNFTINDIPPVQQKVGGVKVSINLTKLHQKVNINWVANIIQVVDTKSFVLKSKNINITLNAHLDAKVGLLRKQKGNITITISQLEANTTIMFGSPKCPKSIGFDIQLKCDVHNVNAHIHIQDKRFDNLIIKQVEKLIMPRIPGILQNAIQNKVNPLIADLACNRIQQQVELNGLYYILSLNTTQVPSFDSQLRYLHSPVDITFQNMISNETNNQLQIDDMPGNAAMYPEYDATLSLSSNFLNTVIWLVGDAKLLNLEITNAKILNKTSDPPIALNTTNLSILLPTLKTKEWQNKQVILLITPSTDFEHLLVRSGRIVTVLSLSIKFVVKLTNENVSTTDCLADGECVVACDLNMTLPLSLALKINKQNIKGLLHSVSAYSIEIINSLININLPTFKSIVNSIIGSMLPTVNSQLAASIPTPPLDLPKNITKYLNITNFSVQTFQDCIGVGLNLKV